MTDLLDSVRNRYRATGLVERPKAVLAVFGPEGQWVAPLAALAGGLGGTYAIPIIYVPPLMITHVVAFYLLVQRPAAE